MKSTKWTFNNLATALSFEESSIMTNLYDKWPAEEVTVINEWFDKLKLLDVKCAIWCDNSVSSDASKCHALTRNENNKIVQFSSDH